MKYKTHIKSMVHVLSTMWRMTNQPSNSTSCSDNALRLLVLVTGRLHWGLQVTSSFFIWGCVLKGCFERGIFWRATCVSRGIEDFHLEGCPSQPKWSWIDGVFKWSFCFSQLAHLSKDTKHGTMVAKPNPYHQGRSQFLHKFLELVWRSLAINKVKNDSRAH